MKNMFRSIATAAIVGAVFFILGTQCQRSGITGDEVLQAGSLIGLPFEPAERDSMLDDLKAHLKSYKTLRGVNLPNSIPPALQFNPIPVGVQFNQIKKPFRMTAVKSISLPKNRQELAFYSVRDLSELIRQRKISSQELTRIYINRLKKYDPILHCVITLTEDLAMQQARQADEEIAAGHYRGPLHGIPYGVKDLLAVKGYKTTWGAAPYKDQMINEDATVVKELRAAGAVLIAKLSMGALAWGDVWFGGKTRNPWDIKQGSSGSSAGPASATSAGLVAFSIGTETWGSIVSPSTRCGVSGLRPTYGRVSRTGAMALSWSMDKIGPICRSVEDCALVFNTLIGPDKTDQTLIDLPFNYTSSVDISKLHIGYIKADFDSLYPGQQSDRKTLDALRKMGAKLIPVTLPDIPVSAISFILDAEAAAAFDNLTRSGDDKLLVRQGKNAWPNVFRAARFIPAVEYIQANRLRYQLIQQMAKLMRTVDLYVAPSLQGDNLLLTNLSGHPCVVLPNGFDKQGHPLSISFTGKLYDEATLLAVAGMYQRQSAYQHLQPPLFAVEENLNQNKK